MKPAPVKKPVVDLDKIIKESAWDLVEYPVVCCKRDKCKRKDLSLHVDWNYVSREDKVTKFVIQPDLSDSDPFQNICLFETTFQNNSTSPQQFTFKNTRQTVSTFEISVQEGLSIGGNFNFSFSLPAVDTPGAGDDMKHTASLGGHLTWSGTVGEKLTKSDTLTWGIDSQVTVGANEKVLAQLGVREAHFVAELELETIMTVTSASGIIPIDVKDKSTNEIIDVVGLTPRDLCEGQEKLIFVDEKGKTNRFSYKTSALCKAVYGVEQLVSVTPIGSKGLSIHLQELPCGLEETLRTAPLASMDSVATST